MSNTALKSGFLMKTAQNASLKDFRALTTFRLTRQVTVVYLKRTIAKRDRSSIRTRLPVYLSQDHQFHSRSFSLR